MSPQNMLKQYEISAPGKVILHGEHSVVYGKPAVAGPIGLKTHFVYKENASNQINIHYRTLKTTATISIENLKLFLENFDCLTDIEPMDFFNRFETEISQYLSSAVDLSSSRQFGMASAATMFLLNKILRTEGVDVAKSLTHGLYVSIDSDMSIGAGLGSSASYAVCLAAGFYVYSQIMNLKFTEQEQLDKFTFKNNTDLLKKISAWAFESEIIMHEKPSGIDNTICTFGKLIKFRRGLPPDTLNLKKQLHILIVDTGVSRSTSTIVAKVADLRGKYSNVINSIFDSMAFVVDDVIEILENNDDDAETYEKLKPLISINNNLLRAIGVSHPSLEKVFRIAEKYNYHSKLTGAGGGGCAFILLPPTCESDDNYRDLCEELKQEKYFWMKTTIDGDAEVNFKYLA